MKKKPIIHFITNYVTMNDVANVSIAMGNSPMMAEEKEELKEMYSMVDGLVVNLGTINKERVQLIYQAMEEASSRGIPILLDPVGVGISKYRLELALDLISKFPISLLKMNGMEALAIANQEISKMSWGIDSKAEIEGMEEVVQKIYNSYFQNSTTSFVIVTGKEDFIAYGNGKNVKKVLGGSPMQSQISGSGCMLNAVLIKYLISKPLSSIKIVEGLRRMNRASELAAKKTTPRSSLAYKEELIKYLKFLEPTLYFISDSARNFEQEILPKTKEALALGIQILQYRPKNKSEEEKREEGRQLRKLCQQYAALFIVNDDPYLAKEIQADGVHLGREDMSIRKAREIVGEQSIIGATAKTLEQAIEAEEEGADYLGIGAVFPSSTKKEAIGISIEELERMDSYRKENKGLVLPMYGIGGIHAGNAKQIAKYFDGLVMVSGIYDSKDLSFDLEQCRTMIEGEEKNE
ncbi:MAG: thiamine phosphate synthase [Vallitaleaceae bacterium]|nr:thiamine phosphate synthase [Vallitaleaceae bacterium]